MVANGRNGGTETLEQLVTKLAPLYKERNIAQAELQKLTLRLEKLNDEITGLEARLRELQQPN